MTDQHPITPPPLLVEELQDLGNLDAIQRAYQAGADYELEACCKWMSNRSSLTEQLRAARRPKPPSLRKQACDALDTYVYGDPNQDDKVRTYNTIRRALEALPNA